jgi:S-adenosyl methyltransferase
MSDAHTPDQSFVAGLYDHYLGGTGDGAADRAAGEQTGSALPGRGDPAWGRRSFLQRAVEWMAGDRSIRQFPEFGVGLSVPRHVNEPTDGRTGYLDSPRGTVRGTGILAGMPGAVTVEDGGRVPGAVLDRPTTRCLSDLF